jgi:hypothetical protein
LQEIYMVYFTPLVLIFQIGKLASILVSRYDVSTLNRALTYSSDTIRVFLYNADVPLREDVKNKMEKLFDYNKVRFQNNFFHILPLVVMAASLSSAISWIILT